jgi:hypothetical protein
MITERDSLGSEFRHCSAYPTQAESLVDSQVYTIGYILLRIVFGSWGVKQTRLLPMTVSQSVLGSLAQQPRTEAASGGGLWGTSARFQHPESAFAWFSLSSR